MSENDGVIGIQGGGRLSVWRDWLAESPAGDLFVYYKMSGMEQHTPIDKEMDIKLRLTAAPALQFNKPEGPASTGSNDGFYLQATTSLPYTLMNKVFKAAVVGKRFDLSEGLISTHIIIEKGMVEADSAGNLLIQAHFGGSFYGSIYIKGRPQYDATLRAIRLAELNYDIQSSSLLLRLGKSLLANKIGDELIKRSVFQLQPYFDKARAMINSSLEKQWSPAVKSTGKVQDIIVQSVSAEKEMLVLELACTGNVMVEINL